jgi:hypothetical protein
MTVEALSADELRGNFPKAFSVGGIKGVRRDISTEIRRQLGDCGRFGAILDHAGLHRTMHMQS